MPVHTRFVLYPYNMGSTSARALRNSLPAKRVRPNGNYHYRLRDLVINWGNSVVPHWGTLVAMSGMLNKPQNVANASEKTRTFQILQTVMPNAIPQWTRHTEEARGWLINPIYGTNKNAVVCRTLTRANSGRGIVLASRVEELVSAPLYTRYKPKTAEYRIHVTARYGVHDYAQKKRRNGLEEPEGLSRYIRSYDNGYVFCRDGVTIPDSVAEAAEQAIHALGLDFGAVDIGYHPEYGISIYEVNTAPGIEGHTLESYVNVFRRFL